MWRRLIIGGLLVLAILLAGSVIGTFAQDTDPATETPLPTDTAQPTATLLPTAPKLTPIICPAQPPRILS
ncbi:MAG: hypothetical protein LC121_01380, partial [Anaerolineae bacterium]|nr:hypothetical protein [Anaerolineae bacterium]